LLKPKKRKATEPAAPTRELIPDARTPEDIKNGWTYEVWAQYHESAHPPRHADHIEIEATAHGKAD
jgi:hypothetical protein